MLSATLVDSTATLITRDTSIIRPAPWTFSAPVRQCQSVELLGMGKGRLYTLEATCCLRSLPQASNLPSGLTHLPPTLALDQRVTGPLGFVSTAKEGTEEEEEMQDEKDRGEGKSALLV